MHLWECSQNNRAFGWSRTYTVYTSELTAVDFRYDVCFHKRKLNICRFVFSRWGSDLRVWNVRAREHTGSGGRCRVAAGGVHIRSRLPVLQHCTSSIARAAIPLYRISTSWTTRDAWCPALPYIIYVYSLWCVMLRITLHQVVYFVRLMLSHLCSTNKDSRKHVIHIKCHLHLLTEGYLWD